MDAQSTLAPHPSPSAILDTMYMNTEYAFRSVKYYTNDLWMEYGDRRVSAMPLLGGGPWYVVALTLCYLYFVKVIGPAYMKHREPFNLRYVMITHNFLLVLINGLGCVVGVWGSNWGYKTMHCAPIDSERDSILLYLGWIYYITKYLDFLDTVYFVLRKKYTHVSGLHVFHHSIMPIWCWIFFRFSTYTNNGFIPLVNALVHTVMYTYYALAAIGPQMQKYLWWKRYITVMQLVQFVVVTIHSTYFLLDPGCECSKLLILSQVLHGVFFFHLFYSFYRRTYAAVSVCKPPLDELNNGGAPEASKKVN